MIETDEWQAEALDQYVALFTRIGERVGDDRAACVILDQIGKDSRVRAMNGDHGMAAGSVERRVVHGDEPATDSQRKFLKRLGVKEVPTDRQHASELIDAAKKR